MRVAVLGLGPSLKDYKESSNYDVVIGVNDIEKYNITVDYLLVLDPPENFTKDRLSTIKNSKPRKNLVTFNTSYYDEFNPIKLQNPTEMLLPYAIKSDIQSNTIDNANIFPTSKTSTFVGIVFAFRLGATYIKVYGMDLIGHKHISLGNNAYKLLLIASEWLLGQFKRLRENGVDITFEWTKDSFYDRHFKEETT